MILLALWFCSGSISYTDSVMILLALLILYDSISYIIL